MAANIFRVNLCAIRSGGDVNGNTVQSSVNVVIGASQAPKSTTPVNLSSELRILDKGASCSLSIPVSNLAVSSQTQYTFCGRTETPGGPFEYGWEFARVQDGKRITGS